MRSRPARLALALTTGAVLTALLAAPTAGTAVATTATPAARAGADTTLDILVLGDSYSAGNGATDDQGAVRSYGPVGCRRSTVNWSEKYAAALRQTGQAVNVVNHACSGGVTADFTSPRVLDTATNKTQRTPAGVTTTKQADAALAKSDPCNTKAFPDEEFWTYHATNVNPALVTYDCTRKLRPQADFVTRDVDLVLFTMGGNDAGFSSIVAGCFVPGTKTANGCKDKVEAARALLPTVQDRLRAGIAALRASGLRDDAKMVQLGYPWLQVDNNYTVDTLGQPSYAAGDQVRALVTEGDAAIAAIVPGVNTGHPGQLSFLDGVPQKFSGHEPDATTPIGNPERWVNQTGDGDAVEVWYHPNRLGHIAYAQLLTAQGTFGASQGPAKTRAKVRARVTSRRVGPGARVHLRVRARLTDGSRPHGTVTVRGLKHRKLAATRIRGRDHGRTVLVFRVRAHEVSKLRVIYRDRAAPVVRVKARTRH